jgi:SAM-dependent MidA family methyltransferase
MPDRSPPGAEPASAFLARALFDPEHGYYARRVRTVGARGDFSTAATLSPTLGRAVAAWLRHEALRQPAVRDVVEIGAGDGSLLEVVRDALGPVARRWLRLHVVEASPVLKAQQQARLATGSGPGVTWHDDVPAALSALRGRAFLFHNEVLDAFPVDVVQWSDGDWHELWLEREGRTIRETLRPLTWTDAERADFAALRAWTPSSPPPYRDQRVELQRPVRDWLRAWAPAWKAGAMLTIDYGDVFPELYDRRPRGTLRAYLLHQRLEGEDVWANAGWQDVTCDVDFTDVRAWAAALGWREALFTTQERFVRDRVPERLHVEADRVLLHPLGAGGAFKVLVHRVG